MDREVSARADRMRQLLSSDRATLVEFLHELGEFDARRCYEAFGYTSIYQYCRRQLGMVDGSIFRRVETARLIRKFPVIARYLLELKLCMTAIAELRDVLTEANLERILDEAIGRSRDEILALVARESAPRASAPPTMIRKLPATRITPIAPIVPPPPSMPTPTPVATGDVATVFAPATEPSEPAVPASEPPTIEESYLLRMTVNRKFVAVLERAQSILSHSIPSRDVPAVLLRALEELVERDDKKHRVQPAKKSRERTKKREPHAANRAKSSTYIPAAIRKEVWERDGGRCTHPTADGGVCGSTYQIEFDHAIPRAKGGRTEPGNLRLRCRRHNDKHAREQFGEAFMAAKKAARRGASPPLRERSGRTEDGMERRVAWK